MKINNMMLHSNEIYSNRNILNSVKLLMTLKFSPSPLDSTQNYFAKPFAPPSVMSDDCTLCTGVEHLTTALILIICGRSLLAWLII